MTATEATIGEGASQNVPKLSQNKSLKASEYIIIFEGTCIEGLPEKLHSKCYFTEITEWNLHKT